MAHLSFDATTRLVMMQFSFSNPNVIPRIIQRREAETSNQSEERKNRASGGSLVIEPHMNVSVEGFVAGMEAMGYVLVDGLYQARRNPNQQSQTYHMVRFIYCRKEYAQVTDDFERVRPMVRSELEEICASAFWRVRAFSNPFFQNGVEVNGFRSMCFNFEARMPRVLPDGNPVVQRRRDADGRKIGDPVPIEPAHRLIVLNGSAVLI